MIMRILNLYEEHGPGTQVAALVRNPKGSQPDADAGQVPPLWRIHAGKGEGGKSNMPAKNMSAIKLNMCWCLLKGHLAAAVAMIHSAK